MAPTPTDSFLETKQHGSVLFPFNIYPCTIPQDFPSVALHWQKSMELIYVKKGRGQVQAGMTTMEAAAGDLFILPPGTLHALSGLPGERMEYENIIFDVDFLGSGAADICARQYLVPLAAGRLALPLSLHPGQSEYDAVAACLADAESLCGDKGPGYELGVKAATLRLLFLLLRMNPEPIPPDSPGTQRLKRVLHRIETEYAQPLTVARMAEGCGCSTSHFMRWFRQMTGQSFTEYLNACRLNAAAEVLRATDDTVLAVAERTGFRNLSYFNRAFKARFGMTPKEYRRR